MLDTVNLRKLAKEFEIDEFTVLREYLQIHFLDRFYKIPKLSGVYFKGGTAIRLLFGSSRFSEDLDFSSRVEIPRLRNFLNSATKKLIPEFPGLKIKEVKTVEGYSAKLYLPTEISRQDLTVKLDFSRREVVKEKLTSPIETRLPISGVVLVEHLSKEELLAEKIRALVIRQKGRDLFDLWYLLSKNTRIDIRLMQKKFDLYDKKFSYEELKNIVENWDERDLEQDIRRFLPIPERRIIGELKRLTLEKLTARIDSNSKGLEFA